MAEDDGTPKEGTPNGGGDKQDSGKLVTGIGDLIAIPPMTPGLVTTVQYAWQDGRKRTASLTPVDVHHYHLPVLESTDNPYWFVTDVESGLTGQFPFLNYLTLDHTPWAACVTTSYYDGDAETHTPESLIASFSHFPYNPGGWYGLFSPSGAGHTEAYMAFLDWDQKPWKATIGTLSHDQLPGVLPFRLEKLF